MAGCQVAKLVLRPGVQPAAQASSRLCHALESWVKINGLYLIRCIDSPGMPKSGPCPNQFIWNMWRYA